MSATFPADVRSAKKRSRFSSRGESQKLRVTLTYGYGILQLILRTIGILGIHFSLEKHHHFERRFYANLADYARNMQSHLTKNVFRAILNNEPIHFAQCHGRRGLPPLLSSFRGRRLTLRSPHHLQRRTLFAFNFPPPPTATEQSSTKPLSPETGLKPMRDLSRSLADKSRPPTNDILAKAFRDFFTSRVDTPGVITDFHARLLIVTWKHLKSQQEELEPEEYQAVFSTENLENVLSVLSEARCLEESRDAVQKVARFAFLELCSDRGFGPNNVGQQPLLAYINLLCSYGSPEEARHVVEMFWNQLRKCKPSPWLTVMKGFAVKGDRRQLRRITEELEKQGTKFDRASHEHLTLILIQQDLIEAVKSIYDCPISGNQEPTTATKKAVIKYAVLKSESDWATHVFQSLPRKLTAETRDVVLLWEAAKGGKAAELSAKMKAIAAENPGLQTSLTISTVNDLVELAIGKEDPVLALDFLSLASQWGLQPDTQTHILHLESRVQAGDVDGMLGCLDKIEDIQSVAMSYVSLINRLVTALCMSRPSDALFDQILSLLDPLVENDVRLEAETVAALSHMLLHRRDWDALSELLRPRLGSYDTEERSKIRKSFTTFIFDPDLKSEDAWEAYGILKIAFPETGVATRTEIMTSFFKRNRSDLACMVFGHMRQADKLSHRPKPDTYARCFQGLARTADKENLELVHNMLKLDLEVDINTRILNGLMLAYAACGIPEKSMEIFRDILQSEEGPNHKTIIIFFKACENHHNGAQEAFKMMEKTKRLEIAVDRRMYHAYIEALAAQCEFDHAVQAVSQMESETGYPPTRNTIGLFYNAIPYQYWKDQVEQWAKTTYPDLWSQLEDLPRTEHEEGPKFDAIRNDIAL
ncbi:hypothetical protein Plec18167_008869 [Paecilomyces lecythidis]|uniref:Uncharacterized protein n=1 Tax=Paecilomyces lecythidis TaxID=3004212 RepID=A0ABR3WTY4_9EURO